MGAVEGGKKADPHSKPPVATDNLETDKQAKIVEARLQSLVNILQHEADTIQDFLDYALDEAIKLTESTIGYIYYYDDVKAEFTLNTWSKDVMKECTIAEKKTQYQLEKTGIWGEAVRQKKPIVVNDFQAPNPLKKGYPEGHAKLYKYLTIPVFMKDRIVAVVGVANKKTDYTQTDILQLTLLMDSVWKATYRRQMEILLRESEEKYRMLAEYSDDIIWTLSNDLVLSYISPSVKKQFGYAPDEIIGRHIGEFVRPEKLALVKEQIEMNRAYIERGEDRNVRVEGEWHSKDGHVFFMETVARALYDSSGRHTGFIGISRNITERKMLIQQLQELALHDALTGLPNRTLLYDRFEMVAADARRNNKKFAVMTLDLDNFKTINDTMGHDIGDKLLAEASARLSRSIRKTDTVARLGGDEFVILLTDMDNRDNAYKAVNKLLADFRQPFVIDDHVLDITISAGMAFFPDNGTLIEELLKVSDRALYVAKERGRNTFAILE